MSPSRRRVLALSAALVSGCAAAPGPTTRTDTTDTGGTETETDTPATSAPGLETPELDDDWETPSTSPLEASIEPTTLVENLEIPWDVDFTPGGDIYLTERVGRLRRYSGGDLETIVEPSDAIDAGAIDAGSDEQPWWVAGGEGGTMGIAVDPRFPDESFVYVHFTATFSEDDQEQENRVVRYDVNAENPRETETEILTGIPLRNTDAYIHRGGRLTVGPYGYLWATTGDGGFGYATQDEVGGHESRDPSSRAGAILRFTLQGDPAPDNPDIASDADPYVYSYGHRNPQGLDWLPDGTTISAEHGEARDEINLIEPGDDYGWPHVYTEEEHAENPDVHPPMLNTGAGESAGGESVDQTWAPSGCTFYTGDAIPEWRDRLIVAGLVSQRIYVVTLNRPDEEKPPLGDRGVRFTADWLDTDDYVATAHPVLEDEIGRVRHVAAGPDGALYAITSNRDGRASGEFPRENDDVLVRLDPA